MYPSAALSFDIEMAQWPAAACATARAFNRWIEEEWGYAYADRIFCAPYISLLLVDEAVQELERVLALGARLIQIRLGAVAGRSPAHPDFDPFWARVQEAGLPVALHISGNGCETVLSEFWGRGLLPITRSAPRSSGTRRSRHARR
jgi:predicted TIM-barrel fold metal-dependent hydrolase